MLDDGRAVADSTIICEYLEDAFPTPALFPAVPFERARMRTIEDLCDRALDAVSCGFWIATARKTVPEANEMLDAARGEFAQLLARLKANSAIASFSALPSASPTSPQSVTCRPPRRWEFR